MLEWLQPHKPADPREWTKLEHDDYNEWLDEIVAHIRNNPQNLHPTVRQLLSHIAAAFRPQSHLVFPVQV